MAERKPESGDMSIATGYSAYAKPDQYYKHNLFYFSDKIIGAFRGGK